LLTEADSFIDKDVNKLNGKGVKVLSAPIVHNTYKLIAFTS